MFSDLVFAEFDAVCSGFRAFVAVVTQGSAFVEFALFKKELSQIEDLV
jgi:hypothetical protein